MTQPPARAELIERWSQKLNRHAKGFTALGGQRADRQAAGGDRAMERELSLIKVGRTA